MNRGRPFAQRRKVEKSGRRSQAHSRSRSSTSSVPTSTRRRTRQRRREEDSQGIKNDEAASRAPLKNVIRKHPSRRRYVKSKPPTAMPGGRVICAGQGTLTEVSKSFYVAYGSIFELSEATRDLHLVVPVNDELQEVTDEESPIPVVEPHKNVTTERDDVPFQDLGCASLLMESPRIRSMKHVDSVGASLDEASFMAAMHPGLPSKPTTSQLPMTWYSSPPWTTVKPSMDPFPTTYDTQAPTSTSDFDNRLFNDMFHQADREQQQQQQQQPPDSSFPQTAGILHSMPSMPNQREEMRERDCTSAPFSPRNAVSDVSLCHTDDCSYFHLAEELMPETKSNSRSQLPSLPVSYWDTMPAPYPRCGMAQGEIPAFLPPHGNPFPPRHTFQQLMSWEAEPCGLPPMAMPAPYSVNLSSHHPRRHAEINPRSFHPQNQFVADHQPMLHSHSNLLI